MRYCRACGRTLHLGPRQGRKRRCDPCADERRRVVKQLQDARHRARHGERRRAQTRAWRARHPERVSAYNRRYYAEHAGTIRLERKAKAEAAARGVAPEAVLREWAR